VLVVELSRPRLSAGGRRLSFRAVALRGNPGGLLRKFRRRADRRVGSPFGRVSLFVDPGTQKVRLPAGLYPAKAPAPGKAVPLRVPPGVGSRGARGVDCYPVQGFKSEANSRYVAAELGYGPWKYPRRDLYGMLRARADTVGPWERYQFCSLDGFGLRWSIFTNANGRWASTEINYGGPDRNMLRARATSIGPWEQYRIYCIDPEDRPGAFAIYSTASDRYVAAELGYKGDDYGMLRARSSDVGAWEAFSRFPGCSY
jgi:hypothetical protein